MAKGPKTNDKGTEFAPAIADDRFSRLQTDPRFLRPNRDESKVVVDDRFKGLLSGGLSGKKKGRLDKYGRKTQRKTQNEGEKEMERLYKLESAEQDEAGGSGSASSSEHGEEEQARTRRIDYARGEGVLESSEDDSSDDDESKTGSESGSESEGVTIGTAAARRKEKQRLRFAEDESEDSEGVQDADDAEDFDELQVAEEDLAELDAQAERRVKQEAIAAKKSARAAPTRTGDTSRLAAVNMDWDHIRAIDLYKVFSSLVSPAGKSAAASSSTDAVNKNPRAGLQIVPVKGRVLNVRVYPSEFGIERMARENQEGPPRDIFKRDEDGRVMAKKRTKKGRRQQADSSDESDMELFEVDEGGEFDEEALRNYQLERLRYYYAIVTFDAPQTARHVLDEIDGTEMERTANVFDLSFVPEDMTFPDRKASNEDLTDAGWRDEATETSDGGLYKGVDFTTDALRHSKVKLTWDADDPQRTKVTRQLAQEPLTIDNLRDEDFKAYLASDSEPSDEEDGGQDEGRSKMRSLLGLGLGGTNLEGSNVRVFGKSNSSAFEDGRKARGREDEEGEGGRDMQITFMPGLSEAAERKKKGLSSETAEETTLGKYMRKQREKKERKRASGRDVPQEDQQQDGVHADGPIGFDDPFFASDNDADFERALADEQGGRAAKGKGEDKARKRVEIPKEEDGQEDMQLMVDSDSGDDAGHFAIKDVLKAEQEGKGKKSRWAKKKEKKGISEQGKREQQVQENFAIDVQDERFQGVFNDHRFALDPSHPSFLKTKSMEKLMDERRKREKQQRRGKSAVSVPIRATNGGGGETDLTDLVQSVKKRTAGDRPGPSKKKRS